MTDTVIAIEDEHFYSTTGSTSARSAGPSPPTSSRAAWQQGGSTITQQVVKNSIVGATRTSSRKMREAVLAVELEKEMTKEEILERYLNTIYFGQRRLRRAGRGRALLQQRGERPDWAAGGDAHRAHPQPEPLRPVHAPRDRQTSPPGPRARRARAPASSDHRARPPTSLEDVPLPTEPEPARSQPNDYFVEAVKQQLLDDERLGATPTARYNAVFGGGLRIYTTFDPYLQCQALQARKRLMARVPGNNGDGTFDLGPRPANGVPPLRHRWPWPASSRHRCGADARRRPGLRPLPVRPAQSGRTASPARRSRPSCSPRRWSRGTRRPTSIDGSRPVRRHPRLRRSTSRPRTSAAAGAGPARSPARRSSRPTAPSSGSARSSGWTRSSTSPRGWASRTPLDPENAGDGDRAPTASAPRHGRRLLGARQRRRHATPPTSSTG